MAGSAYIEPKRRSGAPLKRLRNIAENPAVAIVADHYDEDWTRLGWVMLQGRADILSVGAEHARAQSLPLRSSRLQGLFTTARNNYRIPFPCESKGDSPPNSATAAGDDGNLCQRTHTHPS